MIKTLLLSTEDAGLKKAAEIIKNGGLAAFPTETVYGLGADAFSPDSAKKAYAAKGRPSDNPLIVHIAKTEDIGRVAQVVPQEALKLAEAFWPGPLTMVLPKRPELPKETTGGLDTVAVRMPASPRSMSISQSKKGVLTAVIRSSPCVSRTEMIPQARPAVNSSPALGKKRAIVFLKNT